LTFANHGAFEVDQEKHMVNLSRVLLYLLFATDIENYSLMSEFLGDRAWMVIMVYTEKDQHPIKLLKTQGKIMEEEGENFYQKMMNYFRDRDSELISEMENSMFSESENSEEDSDETGFGNEF